MNTNIEGDFQICISVPLRSTEIKFIAETQCYACRETQL